MPLVKRVVEPSALCRQTLPNSVLSELECVTNNTLSGVILQLSSLSIHAEDLFGELFTEANAFYNRASKLQDRIDKLSVKVTRLDSNVEEVSLHDINMTKAFRSAGIADQQVVSRESLSKTLRVTYSKAEKPPPLQELNQFREDGRDALKIYTDPDYFFNLWREAMQKELRDAKEKRREQRRKRKANPNYLRKAKVKPAVATLRLKAERMKRGAEFMDNATDASAQNHVSSSLPKEAFPQSQSNHTTPEVGYRASPGKSLPRSPDSIHFPTMLPPSPPPVFDDLPPPPSTDLPEPPLPPSLDIHGRLPEYPVPNNIHPPPPVHVPPPPPNIPSSSNVPPPPAPASHHSAAQSSSPPVNSQLPSVIKTEVGPRSPQAAVDDRGGLLQAICLGINLRKVEEREKTAASSTGANDVASILARRIAIQDSDSESGSFTSDDDDWDEDE